MKKQYSVGITFTHDKSHTVSLGKLLGMKNPYWDNKKEAVRQLNSYIDYINNKTTLKVYKYQIKVRQVTEWEEVTEGVIE